LAPPVTGTHAVPVALPAQLVHEADPVLQAAVVLPATQLLAGPQQPLPHGWLALHAPVHVPVAVLHAPPPGQSLDEEQPQVAPERHAVPAGLPVQSVRHALPDVPQCLPPIAWHLSVWSQQKPVPHGSLPPTLHVEVHAPARHVGVPPLHALQALPSAPHAPGFVPSTQVVPAQHPPLHAVCDASPHVNSQTWVVVLHDRPAAQSVTPLHGPPASLPPESFTPVSAPLLLPLEDELSAPLDEPVSEPVSCVVESPPPPVSAPLLPLLLAPSLVASTPLSSPAAPPDPPPPHPVPTTGTPAQPTNASRTRRRSTRFIAHLPRARRDGARSRPSVTILSATDPAGEVIG
jgi:hypothetical protein